MVIWVLYEGFFRTQEFIEQRRRNALLETLGILEGGFILDKTLRGRP